jgi:hypothetical protein
LFDELTPKQKEKEKKEPRWLSAQYSYSFSPFFFPACIASHLILAMRYEAMQAGLS